MLARVSCLCYAMFGPTNIAQWLELGPKILAWAWPTDSLVRKWSRCCEIPFSLPGLVCDDDAADQS